MKFQKVKDWVDNHANAIRFGVPAVAAPASAVGMGMVVCAEEPTAGNVTAGMTTALSTAFANVQADVISIITTALPYALPIMGIMLALTIGIRAFRRFSKS